MFSLRDYFRHRIAAFWFRRAFSSGKKSCDQKQKREEFKVAVIGATSHSGRILSLFLKQNSSIDKLSLYDNKSTISLGLDLSHIDTTPTVWAFEGLKSLKDAVCDSKVVVVIGGERDDKCKTEKDLFEQNFDMIRVVAVHCSEFCPQAFIAIASPPVNYLVPTACEEMKRYNEFAVNKIFGVCTDSVVRANSLLAAYAHKDPTNMVCPVLGGTTPDTIVPIFLQAKPSVKIPEPDIKLLTEDLRQAETTLLSYKDTEYPKMPCHLVAGYCASRFVNNLVKIIRSKTMRMLECAFVAQQNKIAELSPYFGTIVKIGPDGIEGTYMPHLTDDDCRKLTAAAEIVREQVREAVFRTTGLEPDFREYLEQEKDSALKEATCAAEVFTECRGKGMKP